MSSRIEAALVARHLEMNHGEALCLRLPLDQGGRHRLVVDQPAAAACVIAALDACPGVGVLAADGGLPGAMTVAESLALALRYGQDEIDPADDEREMEAALQLCGIPPQRIARIGATQPMRLSQLERWAIGLARWMLRPPELLVVDRLFAGLARRDAEQLIAVQAAYHERHPFRSALFVDLDSHELPELPACRSLTYLAEDACPC